jgi:hypothetical protein
MLEVCIHIHGVANIGEMSDFNLILYLFNEDFQQPMVTFSIFQFYYPGSI